MNYRCAALVLKDGASHSSAKCMRSARGLNVALDAQVIRRYHVQDREEYKQYNRLCGMVTKLTSLLYRLDPTDDDRIKVTNDLLNKYVSLCCLLPDSACCTGRN